MTDTLVLDKRRFHSFDSFRGLMLIIITLNHTRGNPFIQYTWQPLGFFTAAEGFVFISGILAGYVYGSPKYSTQELKSKILNRKKLIALVWLTSCALILAKHLISPISPERYQDFLSTILLFPNPLDTDEILVLYMILIFLLQYYLLGLRKGKWILVLCLSSIPYLVLNSPEFHERIPLLQNDLTNSINEQILIFRGVKGFSILAWQFLFAIAVTAGFYLKRKASFKWTLNPVIILTAVSIFTFQFLVEVGSIDFKLWNKFADRPSLGPTRMLSVLSFALVFSYLARLNKYNTRIIALEYLGKQSLYLYGYQAVFIITIVNPWMDSTDAHISKTAILFMTVSSLWLAAYVADIITKKRPA